MFTESVNQLDKSLDLCSRYIYPALYIIPFIIRKKTNFMQHMIHLLFVILMLNILIIFYHGKSSASITAFSFVVVVIAMSYHEFLQIQML